MALRIIVLLLGLVIVVQPSLAMTLAVKPGCPKECGGIATALDEVRNIKFASEAMCTPDLYSYATMLSAYVNASDMDGAGKFFRRLKQDGLSPSEVTFGTLIKGYARVNNLSKMMEKYEEMQSLGIKVNQTVFTTIMDAYGKNKDFGSAVIWFKEMASSGVSPDKKAKNILLSLAKSKEELEEANMLIGDMDQRDDAPRLNGNLRFVRTEATDEEDGDDDYGDDYDEDSYGCDDVEEAISTAVEQDDAMTFNATGMFCVH